MLSRQRYLAWKEESNRDGVSANKNMVVQGRSGRTDLAPLVAPKGDGSHQGDHCAGCGESLLLLVVRQVSLLGLLDPAWEE